VRPVADDARHFLRTATKKYDLVVFALIDSLTLQSAFSGVRLESYMFTEESFRAVRNVLKPDGVLVVYNYFREPWLVDRLANTAAAAFGEEPVVHVHPAKDQLGVMVVGPRLKGLAQYPEPPSEVTAFNQGSPLAPPVRHARDRAIVPATDNWPFLYMKEPHLPRHYTNALLVVLLVSILSVFAVVRGAVRKWSWEFFFLGAGFMLLETKSIIQFALLWGSTWVVASLTIAAVLVMALLANWTVAHVEIRRPRVVGAVLLALLAFNYLVPWARWLSTADWSSRWCTASCLQPDLLRGAPVRFEHQAVGGRHHRLRRKTCSARWWARGRVPVAADGLPVPAAARRGLLRSGTGRAQAGESLIDQHVLCHRGSGDALEHDPFPRSPGLGIPRQRPGVL